MCKREIVLHLASIHSSSYKTNSGNLGDYYTSSTKKVLNKGKEEEEGSSTSRRRRRPYLWHLGALPISGIFNVGDVQQICILTNKRKPQISDCLETKKIETCALLPKKEDWLNLLWC